MFVSRRWTRMTREQAEKIIALLTGREDALVFSTEATDVSWLELPFYKNYRLYRLTNYATMPVFSMTYLSNGSEFIALDGTANPIYTVDEKEPLTLVQDTVVPYLEFFFGNVQGSEGEVYLIRDPLKMPFIDSFTPAQKQSILQSFRPLNVVSDTNTNSFRVSGTLHYGGGLLAATIVVQPDGKIAFEQQSLLLSGIHFPHNPYGNAWIDG